MRPRGSRKAPDEIVDHNDSDQTTDQAFTVARAPQRHMLCFTERTRRPTHVFPNPFAETATINVSLESSAEVTVEVMNSVGQIVSRVDYGTLTGNQNLTLDGTKLNSGVYFVHVRIGDELATKRVTIAK